MHLLVLHLSDIHISSASAPILQMPDKIASAILPRIHGVTRIVILVSGDIAFSGKAAEYDLALVFLEDIRKRIAREFSGEISYVVVPGNHDCNFDADNGARRGLIALMDRDVGYSIDDSIIETCTVVQADFFQFRELLESTTDRSTGDRLWRTTQFTVGSKVVAIDGLNVSWVSRKKEEPGRLIYPVERYESQRRETVDLRLVVMHHPFNWFGQTYYRPFRRLVKNAATLIITGHEHVGGASIIDDTEVGVTAFVEGCVLQEGNVLLNSGFNIISIDLEQSRFKSVRFLWNGELYHPQLDGSWADYRGLPERTGNRIVPASDFQQSLDDPGGAFKHFVLDNLTLADIFIYPDMLRQSDGEAAVKEIVSSSQLISGKIERGGVIIEGEEKSGRSSLLRQLYRVFLRQGLVPILLRGRDLRRSTPDEVDTCLRRAIEVQYGAPLYEAIIQLSISERVLLIDDLDDTPVRAAGGQAFFLNNLLARADKVIFSVSTMFELREVLNSSIAAGAGSYDHFKLQPFGYKKRVELSQRWYSLGQDDASTEADFVARCDLAEKLMNVVMAKSLVPSYPLYLLTLLQSIEAGSSGSIKNGSLGYYYQFLLTQALEDAGVKSEKLTLMFQYCSHLAWFFHESGKKDLDYSEIQRFNEAFSRKWTTVDLPAQMERLISARVLQLNGDQYCFRYPYIYYFLKGKYLSETLQDPVVRRYIEHCCSNLYVRDYANTVVFLAHHTAENILIDSVASGLCALFDDKECVTFDGDIDHVTRLIVDAPTLQYSGGSPAEHRIKRGQMQDELERGDGLSECEVPTDKIGILARLTMLFKTAEILGLILKSQYSKILRERRVELVACLFSAPMRALSDFYEFLRNHPDAMVAEIEVALEKKGRLNDASARNAVARSVASYMIQMFTFSFFNRTAQNANSADLLEDVQAATANNGTRAFRLLQLSVLLDSPKPFPRSILGALHRECKNDLIVDRLIKWMVVMRLYMFKTSESDMQWINSELGLDMNMQHSIAYADSARKLLK